MADHFNPYHRWLGIPPEEQPPHHYRLLGLVLLESDLEVIRDGAERQMAHVRRYALGQHTELSQRILNELASAKACLTDPVKKAQYDAHLQTMMESVTAAPPPLPVEPSVLFPPPPLVASPVLLQPPQQQSLIGDQKSPGWFLGIALVVVVVGTAGLLIPLVQKPKQVPLQLEPVAPRTLELGESLQVRLRPTEPDRWNGKVRYRLGWGSPAGVAIDPQSGEVSWKPAKAGRQEITFHAVAVADERQQSETVLAVEVREPTAEASRPPHLATIPSQTVVEGAELRVHVPLTDRGTGGKVRFHFAAGAPQGMAIDEVTGEIAWRPKTSGQYSVIVSATNVNGQSDQTVLQVQVKADRKTLSLLPLNPRTITAGQRSMIAAATNEPPSSSRRFLLTDSPGWLTIDAITGVITAMPPLEESFKSYTIMVRVGDGELRDEKPLVVNIQPQMVESLIEPRDYRITFPSGKSVNSEQFREVLKLARSAANSFYKLCDSYNPSAVPLWFDDAHSAVAGFCQLKVLSPHGQAVCFYQGKDPVSMYRRQVQALQPPTPVPTAPVVPAVPTSIPRATTFPRPTVSVPVAPDFWDHVAIQVYLGYDSSNSSTGLSKWSGMVAMWDNVGAKQFFGQYERGARDGLCCLFKEDHLRLVLECDSGNVQNVHLIAGGRIRMTFADLKQGEANQEAKPLIDELNKFEADLRTLDHQFQENVKKAAKLQSLGRNRKR